VVTLQGKSHAILKQRDIWK